MENSALIESPGVPASQLNLGGVMRIPAVRQVTTLIGVAAAVAAGFAIFLWSQTPSYSQLYANLEPADAAQVVDALKGAEIEYRLTDSGSILVPQARLHDARMQMAGQGVAPAGDGTGASALPVGPKQRSGARGHPGAGQGAGAARRRGKIAPFCKLTGRGTTL